MGVGWISIKASKDPAKSQLLPEEENGDGVKTEVIPG